MINLDNFSDQIKISKDVDSCTYNSNDVWFYDCSCIKKSKNIIQLEKKKNADSLIKAILKLVLRNLKSSENIQNEKLSSTLLELESIDIDSYFYHHGGIFLVSNVDQFAKVSLDGTNLSEKEINYILSIKCLITYLGSISYDNFMKNGSTATSQIFLEKPNENL